MRRLTLRSETLTALTNVDLADVAGAATPLCVSNGCATGRCVTDMATLCHLCALTPEVTRQVCTQ